MAGTASSAAATVAGSAAPSPSLMTISIQAFDSFSLPLFPSSFESKKKLAYGSHDEHSQRPPVRKTAQNIRTEESPSLDP